MFDFWIFISAPPAGRSELDELQEEVLRRALEEEQQRRQEKEREAALGFNPRPSKFLDLDQLQIQGTCARVHVCRQQQTGSSDGNAD